METAGKRSPLSYNDKKELLASYDRLPKMSKNEAAKMLKVPSTTLCKILKNREEIECSTVQGTRKRMRTGKDEMVEKAVV